MNGFKLLIIAFVTAMPREGFPGIYRAQRLWPGGKQVEVEVYDCAEDPPQEEGRPVMIGLKSMAMIDEDPRISVKQERARDSAEAEKALEEARGRLTVLIAENNKLAAHNLDLEATLETAREDHARLATLQKQLTESVESMTAEIDKLRTQLAKAEADAKEAAAKAKK